MTGPLLAWLGLFGAAFGAASILPFYSEPVVVAMVAAGYSPIAVILVATLGNTLGAVVNWWLGRSVHRFENRKWFPVKPEKLRAAEARFRKFGTWTLLLSWAPIGGDTLTVVAGIMRVPLGLFLLLVSIGKGGRYVVLVWATLQAM